MKKRILGGTMAYSYFTFDNAIETNENSAAIRACRDFCKETDNLYLYGGTGSGKTHLATAAVRKYVDAMSCYVLVTKPQEILRDIRAADGAAGEDEIIMSASKAGVLLLDDLGVEKPTEFAVSTLYEIIDRRYMNGGGGLIVSSNLSPQELSNKMGDDRIASRLAFMCKGHFYNLGTKDWRI